MYTIKEVSELLGMTEHTIRYYTNLGLVPNLNRDKNNRRLFDVDSITWLAFINHLKSGGMTVKNIKEYIGLWWQGNSTLSKRYDILKKQQEITINQIKEAKQRLTFLQEKANHYQAILNHEIDPESTSTPEEIYSSIKKLLAKKISV
jgi:DNA-binding transcriptional MerR regulator